MVKGKVRKYQESKLQCVVNLSVLLVIRGDHIPKFSPTNGGQLKMYLYPFGQF